MHLGRTCHTYACHAAGRAVIAAVAEAALSILDTSSHRLIAAHDIACVRESPEHGAAEHQVPCARRHLGPKPESHCGEKPAHV